jgi:DNA-binding transcriptional LysR family regulator
MAHRRGGWIVISAELRHLRYFVAVAEERSYTRAAERLHVVQQSVSAAIKQLEMELGVQLLNRTSRRVELTPAGEALLEQGRYVLGAAERAWQAAQAAGREVIPELAIGYNRSLGQTPLSRIHEAVRHGLRNARLDWRSRYNDELIPEIYSGGFDVGLANFPDRVNGLVYEKIADLRLGAVLGTRNPHAGRALLSLGDLADQTILVVPRKLGPRYYDEFAQIFRDAGFEPKLLETPDPESGITPPGTRGCVAGVGPLCFASEFAIRHSERLVCIPLDESAPTVPVELVRKRGAITPALEEFIALCREAGAELVELSPPVVRTSAPPVRADLDALWSPNASFVG